MRIDLTDWAILLEALEGARAPFPALSTLSSALLRAAGNGESGETRGTRPQMAAGKPHPRRRLTWRLVP